MTEYRPRQIFPSWYISIVSDAPVYREEGVLHLQLRTVVVLRRRLRGTKEPSAVIVCRRSRVDFL